MTATTVQPPGGPAQGGRTRGGGTRGGGMIAGKGATSAYWGLTGLFAAQIGFTAYAQLCLPQVAQVFSHLGFPNYFRIELSWLKFAAVIVLLVPAPPRLKEWAYAGLAFTLGSALLAHLAVGDDASKWSWSVGTFVLGAASYYFFRKRLARQKS